MRVRFEICCITGYIPITTCVLYGLTHYMIVTLTLSVTLTELSLVQRSIIYNFLINSIEKLSNDEYRRIRLKANLMSLFSKYFLNSSNSSTSSPVHHQVSNEK